MRRWMVMWAASLALLGVPAMAAPVSFFAYLTGAAENPPNASPGYGWALVTMDLEAHTMHVRASFDDLVAPTTAAHIHCCTAPPGNVGVATQTPSFTGFPLGVTSGDMDELFDMTLATSFNATYITNNGGTPASAEAALFAGMSAGRAYFNIHSTTFPGGEIRGFMQLVPEPATAALALMALAGVATRRRRPGLA